VNIQRDPGRSVVRLPGSFGHLIVEEFIQSVNEELAQGVTALSLDFEATRLIDSAAIGALVSVLKCCRAKGARLTLHNMKENIKELFIQTGFEKIFTIEWEEGVQTAESDIFENTIGNRLTIEKEAVNDRCILYLTGVMTNPEGSRYLKQELLLTLTHYKKIIVDFAQLTFLDSLSISVILNLNKLINKTGGSMRICGPNEMISDLFKNLRIQNIIPFYSSKENALKDWN
jgi:anti-anti-sigma factor